MREREREVAETKQLRKRRYTHISTATLPQPQAELTSAEALKVHVNAVLDRQRLLRRLYDEVDEVARIALLLLAFKVQRQFL